MLTVRKTLEGRRREVLHLRTSCLTAPEPDQPDQSPSKGEGNGRVSGRVGGRAAAEKEVNPTTKPDQNKGGTAAVVGLVGSKTGVDAHRRGGNGSTRPTSGRGEAPLQRPPRPAVRGSRSGALDLGGCTPLV